MSVIEAIQPRTSLLYRSNEIKQKLIAANVDQVVIVVATEPGFSDELVTRALLAAESEEIEPLIVLNKCDLTDKLAAARAQLAVFAGLGYRILELSARDHAEDLRPELFGYTSVLVGQSGMGKSTLVNLICRFYDVTEGAVLIDGVDVRSVPVAEFRQHIGLVLQEPFLFFGTIADNIAYGKPDATRQFLDGLDEPQTAVLHHEANCGSMRTTSEAVVKLLGLTDSK